MVSLCLCNITNALAQLQPLRMYHEHERASISHWLLVLLVMRLCDHGDMYVRIAP